MVDEVVDREGGKETVGVVNFNQGNILRCCLSVKSALIFSKFSGKGS